MSDDKPTLRLTINNPGLRTRLEQVKAELQANGAPAVSLTEMTEALLVASDDALIRHAVLVKRENEARAARAG